MSRSKHPRGISKKRSQHNRKNKEWKKDSVWKPEERKKIPTKVRRSVRKRIRG